MACPGPQIVFCWHLKIDLFYYLNVIFFNHTILYIMQCGYSFVKIHYVFKSFLTAATWLTAQRASTTNSDVMRRVLQLWSGLAPSSQLPSGIAPSSPAFQWLSTLIPSFPVA